MSQILPSICDPWHRSGSSPFAKQQYEHVSYPEWTKCLLGVSHNSFCGSLITTTFEVRMTKIGFGMGPMVLHFRCILGDFMFWEALEVEGRRESPCLIFGHVQREEERQAPVELDVVLLRDPVKETCCGRGGKKKKKKNAKFWALLHPLGLPPPAGLPPFLGLRLQFVGSFCKTSLRAARPISDAVSWWNKTSVSRVGLPEGCSWCFCFFGSASDSKRFMEDHQLC